MDDLIVRTVTRIVVPFLQLYGIYVVLHGHLSPGGGFSGGAILGASMVLCTLAFGLEKTEKKFGHRLSALLESGAILAFVLIGCVGILAGHTFLTNQRAGFFMGEFGSLLSGGMIPLISIAIGIKVASTMVTLFHAIIKEK
jgi:multicomponent Na+:H+ antiporter subunit B